MDNELPPIPPPPLSDPDRTPPPEESLPVSLGISRDPSAISANAGTSANAGALPEADSESATSRREPRPGGARDRYERRRQHATTTRKPASSPRQIRPPQEFRLPALRIPRSSGLIIGLVGAVLFVVVIVVGLGSLRNPTAERQPNALWLGTEWTYDSHTDQEIAAFVEKLRERKIGTVYAWVSYLQYDRTWRAEDQFENVKTFVTQFKKAYPEALLVGWVSLPTNESDNVTTRINDVTLQQEVADFSKRVIDEIGFQGIFLNAEPVWDNDQNYLALLRTLRATIGIKVPLSAAIPPDWSPSNSNIPLPALVDLGTEWAKPYKQSVALLVDQMAVMAYHSGLTSPSDYSQWVAYQVKTFAQAVNELNIETSLIIGVPTFDAELPGHDPLVENVNSAVQGVEMGLQQAGDAARHVDGIALYAEWETDDTEWAAYQQLWADAQ
ncbi:MAG: hypothetical protein ABI835_06580 [Chloroflexota bacterium]